MPRVASSETEWRAALKEYLRPMRRRKRLEGMYASGPLVQSVDWTES